MTDETTAGARLDAIEWRLKSLEARAWPDDGRPTLGVHKRLDAITDTLARVEAALAHPPVEITHTPDGLTRETLTTPTKTRDLRVPIVPSGVVDVDDRMAIKRMAALDRMASKAGGECASGREPMGDSIPAVDQHADYWRDMAALDTPRESKRHARKWWLLWLA